MRVYQRLAQLQGECIPVLLGAGKLGKVEQDGRRKDESVFLATSGSQRLSETATLHPALRQYADVRRMPRDMKWAALNSLRQLHDSGVLHGKADSHSLFIQSNQVTISHWFAIPVPRQAVACQFSVVQ